MRHRHNRARTDPCEEILLNCIDKDCTNSSAPEGGTIFLPPSGASFIFNKDRGDLQIVKINGVNNCLNCLNHLILGCSAT